MPADGTTGRAVSRVQSLLRQLTAPARMLPDFLIIGAPKAGTTSLYAYLSDHPCIRPAITKEVLFFDRRFGRGRNYYRSCFPIRPLSAGRQIMTGEASPYYFQHPLVPERVAGMVPDVRCIVILRDPVERAWSHYRHNVRHGRETLSFREALEREEERAAADRQKMMENSVYFPAGFLQYSYVDGGRYATHLKRWVKHFPLDGRLLVLESSRLFRQPQETLKKVTEFLGLPEFRPDGVRAENVGIRMEEDPEVMEYLTGVFREENEELFRMIGRRFDWR